jgi:hypothetical protein
MGAPLIDPSNKEFAEVINGWNAITKRIYVWNCTLLCPLALFEFSSQYCVLAPALLADVVDFGSFLQTFPNYDVPPQNAAVMSCLTEIHLWLVTLEFRFVLQVLGPNIRFFADHGVRGVFEEGPGVHVGDGTDLEELKDYVMAEMLWDPTLNPEALVSEFIDGYYGNAAPFVRL